ncbi:EthD family reductase [Virgibacillus xinjiangensis]|uniref:EthD family reductase n=1 Tax=Virgibacillus xinjiangensis TaxID=393090 RepID=A0ABV7CTA2_9BACI
MVKLIALYKKPENEQAFDEHYQNVHTPITKKIPGLRKMEVTRIVGAPTGESDYYLLCEMYYDDHSSLKQAMKTEESKESAKDLMSFAGDIVTMMIGEEVE